MESVPPRGSGWVRSLKLTVKRLPTHPLPRGGTDSIQARDLHPAIRLPCFAIRIFISRQRLSFHLDAISRLPRWHVTVPIHHHRCNKMLVQVIYIFNDSSVETRT